MTNIHRIPRAELDARLAALRAALTKADPLWRLALISDKINMYYFTGTMQVGVLTVTPESAALWVRRDPDRAREESLFPDLRPMKSFRFLAALLNGLRARKSPYELDLLREAGAIHARVMHEAAPALLREGLSEAELGGLLYTELLRQGSMGISRFNQPLGEDIAGLVAFSENALRTTAFDGPGGTAGTCTAVQGIGSPNRLLRKGDLVYLDMPAGREGYHTDKSIVFHFGSLADNPP